MEQINDGDESGSAWGSDGPRPEQLSDWLSGRHYPFRKNREKIEMFQERQALSADTAMPAEALGFQRRSILQVRAFRDYKPAALQFLMRNNIVQVTDDGRLYLSEAVLAQTNLAQKVK